MCITEISRISDAYLKQTKASVNESVQGVRHVKAIKGKNDAGEFWKLVDADTGRTIQTYGFLDNLKKDVKEFGYLLMNEVDEKKEEFHFVKCSKCGAKLCKETDSYRFDADGNPVCYDCANSDESCKDECTKTIKASAAIPMLMEEEKNVSESSDGFKIYFEEEPIDVLRNRSWECDDLYNKIKENNAEEAFNELANEVFPDGAGMTEFNDWCRFDDDNILESLGIYEDEEEEDGEDLDEMTNEERELERNALIQKINAIDQLNAAERRPYITPEELQSRAEHIADQEQKAANGEYGVIDRIDDNIRAGADNTRAAIQEHPLAAAGVAAGLGAAATAGVVALNNRRRRKRGL